jgi:hypothetical protein
LQKLNSQKGWIEIDMSFGFSIGDFIAAIELANKIRKEFADAPSQFNDISDECVSQLDNHLMLTISSHRVRSLSIVLQDVEVSLSHRQLSSQEKVKLTDIAHGCKNVLDKLGETLDKYGELETSPKSVRKELKRAWKRLMWEPEEVRELRSRISNNVGLLNAFNI